MTPDAATALAKRIINTCRPTPPMNEWVEVLTELDDDIAAASTFRYFRTASANGLAIPTFVEQYKRFTQPSSHTTRTAPANTDCRHCGGTGWQPGPPITHTADGRPHRHPYTTVTPCHCTRSTR